MDKMESNPCYGDTVYYEPVSQCRAKADSEKPATNNGRDIDDQVSSKTNKQPSVSRTNRKWIVSLTIIVTLQTLSLVVLFALAGHSHLRSNQLSQQLSSSLEQVTSLQSSLNTLVTQQASTTSQVTGLQSSVNSLTSRINSSSNYYICTRAVSRENKAAH